MSPRKSGGELRAAMDELGATHLDIAAESRLSIATLYKIYRDDPKVTHNTKSRVWEALERLKAKARAAG